MRQMLGHEVIETWHTALEMGWQFYVPPLAGSYSDKLCFVKQSQPRVLRQFFMWEGFLHESNQKEIPVWVGGESGQRKRYLRSLEKDLAAAFWPQWREKLASNTVVKP